MEETPDMANPMAEALRLTERKQFGSDLSLMRARLAIAEARVSSSTRHAAFLSEYADLMAEMRDFWQSTAPAGTALPPEIEAKVESFRAAHDR